MSARINRTLPDGRRVIFRPYKTVNGRRIWAWQVGKKAFMFVVKDER
jgi:hypothetical protein